MLDYTPKIYIYLIYILWKLYKYFEMNSKLFCPDNMEVVGSLVLLRFMEFCC